MLQHSAGLELARCAATPAMIDARVAQIFADALEQPEEERRAFVARSTEDTPDVRSAVLRLLAAHDAAGNFLEPLDPARAASLLEQHPALDKEVRIGPYRLVRELGRGGMGTVYQAERADGAFEHSVALKVIKRGMDSDAILRRFLNERQILARLQHPLIARLYDGGLAGDGRPYFAMEYVEGVPITRYCDRRALDVDSRLRLFQDVCRAVQYAHANLVVHRDIKPSNILVTAAGEIKLLDFGIARLLDEDGEEGVALTETGQRLMTPDYAAPEQVRGEAITTATDVYGLGLVLYELLTGHRPYRIDHRSPEAVRRILERTDPTRPSTAVCQDAQIRRADGSTETISAEALGRERNATPQRLRRKLAGDLDRVLLKALRKEPEARYASADQLRDDIALHLAGLPISARPATLGYRLRKLVDRHALAAAVSVGVTAVLVAMGLTFTVRLIQERNQTRREAERAERLQLESQQVSDFMVELFRVADPGNGEGRTVTARTLLDRAAGRIEDELGEQPQVAARLLRTVADTYRGLGLYDEAEKHYRKSLEVSESFDDEPRARAASLVRLGTTLTAMGKLPEAESNLQRGLEILEAAEGSQHQSIAVVLQQLGSVRLEQGKPQDAEPLLRRALGILQQTNEPDSAILADVDHVLGQTLLDLGRFDESARYLEEAIRLLEELHGNNYPLLANPLQRLATLHSQLGQHQASLPLFERALQLRRASYGPEHPKTAVALANLGINYLELGDLDRADELFERAEHILEQWPDSQQHALAMVLQNRGNVALERHRNGQAETFYRDSLSLFEALLPPGHPQVGLGLNNLGEALMGRNRLADAQPLFERSLAIFGASLGKEHLFVSTPLLNLARLYDRQGDVEQAEPLYRRALEIRRRVLEPSSDDRKETEQAWADFLREVGRESEGAEDRSP